MVRPIGQQQHLLLALLGILSRGGGGGLTTDEVSPSCEELCQGLQNCDEYLPSTCAIVDSYGCECSGACACKAGPRRLASENETTTACASTSCWACNAECDDYAIYGFDCVDLESHKMLFASGNLCDCSGQTCSTSIPRAATCDGVAEEVIADSEAELRAAAQTCSRISLASFLDMVDGELVVNASEVAVRGYGLVAAGRTAHRVVAVMPRASLALDATSISGGVVEGVGGCILVSAYASLTARRVVVANCWASVMGGGVAVWTGASAVFSQGSVVRDAYSAMGGCFEVHNSASLAWTEGSVMERCYASTGGGGLAADGASEVLVTGASIIRSSSAEVLVGGCVSIVDHSLLTLTNGSTLKDCYCAGPSGGAVFLSESYFVMDNASEISRALVDGRGAGIYAYDDSAVLMSRDATISDAVTLEYAGGAISCTSLDGSEEGGLVFLDAARILNGHAGGDSGGCMTAYRSSVVLQNTQLDSCSTFGDGQESFDSGGGGCVKVTVGEVYVVNSSITNCTSFNHGGCVSVEGVDMTIEDTYFRACVSSRGDGGGAVHVDSNSEAVLDRVVIAESTALEGSGGGLAVVEGTRAVLKHSRVLNCTADSGGGAVVDDATLFARDAEFADNEALVDGGGIAILNTDGRLYAAAGCDVIIFTFDFTDPRASLGSGSFWIRNAETGSTVDASGAHMLGTALEGSVKSHVHCVEPGTYDLWTGDISGQGWDGGFWNLELPPKTPLDVYQDDYAVRTGVHSELAARFVISAAATATHALASSNRAGSHGGGLFVSQRAEATIHGVGVVENEAEYGGGIAVDTLSTMQLVRSTLRKNHAWADGGGAHGGQLSSTTFEACVVESNAARAEGGGLAMDRILETTVETSTVRRNLAAEGGGIHINLGDEVRSVVSETSFLFNRATNEGGAASIVDSFVDFKGGLFASNVAEAGSGGALRTRRADVSLDKLESCVPTIVVVDWEQTTAKCDAVLLNGNYITCDFGAGSCDVTREYDDCLGCRCSSTPIQDSENYYELLEIRADDDDDDDDGPRRIEYGLPATGGLVEHEYCLSSGTYAITAHATQGRGWHGGELRVSVVEEEEEEDDGGGGVSSKEREVVRFAFSEDDGASKSATFEVSAPVRPRATRFLKNQALRGGGGAVSWEVIPPRGLDVVRAYSSGNEAGYGWFDATPAVALLVANATIEASSGEVSPPVVIALLDERGQIVSSSPVSATAILDATGSSATTVNNIAVSEAGYFAFNTLIVADRPGARVNVTVSSALETLYESQHTITFLLRECLANERHVGATCEVCDASSYLSEETQACVECSRGMECDEPGTALASLETDSGYYRTTATSREVYRCNFDNNACGGPAGACADGYEAVLCGSCEKGYEKTFEGRCVRCTTESRLLAITGIAFISFAFFVFLGWLTVSRRSLAVCAKLTEVQGGSGANDIVRYVKHAKQQQKNDDHENDDDDQEDGEAWFVMAVVKAKALFSFYAIVSSMPLVVGNVAFPKTYMRFLRHAGVITIDLVGIFPTRCMLDISTESFYVRKLVGTTTAPLCVLVVLAACYYLFGNAKTSTTPEDRDRRRRLKLRVYGQVSLLLIHCALPSTSIAAFQAFVCDEYDDGDGRQTAYLRVEPAVSCDSNLWRRAIAPFAAIMIAVWPVGVVTLYTVLLFSHRDVLNPDVQAPRLLSARPSARYLMNQSMRRLIASSSTHQRRVSETRKSQIEGGPFEQVLAFRFLWCDYKPRCFYFEILEAVRRIMLTAVLAIIAPGTPTQLILGFLVSTAFAVCTMCLQPLVLADDNVLVLTAMICTAASLFLALLLRVDSIGGHNAATFLILVAVLPIVATFYALRSLFRSGSPRFAWLQGTCFSFRPRFLFGQNITSKQLHRASSPPPPTLAEPLEVSTTKASSVVSFKLPRDHARNDAVTPDVYDDDGDLSDDDDDEQTTTAPDVVVDTVRDHHDENDAAAVDYPPRTNTNGDVQ